MKKNVLLLACCFSMLQLQAQNKNYWKVVKESEVSKSKDPWGTKFKPASYKLFSLDAIALRSELTSTPSEKETQTGKKGKIITVPDAEGKLLQFNVSQTLLMEPGLAAKYPGIKTYAGRGISDPSATIQFSVTPSGFHAVITATGKKTYYINALDNSSSIYAVNARNDNAAASFKCSLDESIIKKGGLTDRATSFASNADDDTLRRYRLALCVNGEFSETFLDGTEPDTAAMKSKVMDALIVCLQRANVIYERDFGVRLQFVSNEDTLIFIDRTTDPWPSLSGSSWNNKTQQVINQRIGVARYDIGHLLGKVPTLSDNNGNAGCIACVCNNAEKGTGFTAYYDPTLTDYMVVDYWTHEMGHQFGANHTFTYVNEGSGANIEPGSGSTIMGYAGITGATDVQEHSDDLFSIVSIAQVTENIKTGVSSSCAIKGTTGNIVPLTNAGNNYRIPMSTPFALTGTASDGNAGDNLSYIWEQIDVYEAGSNKYPRTTATTGPIFRTYNYTNSKTRYFPALPYILNGSLGHKWEVLPAVGRKLNFRFTVRDNHAGGGSNMSDDVIVTVDSTSGPFKITVQTQPSAETWYGNEPKTITWDVANTDVAPVNCKNVNILLSNDGGKTFTIALASNTSNDGTENIVVPNINTTEARIKVEAVNNIFFSISDIDFAIQSTLPVTWLSFTAQKMNNAAVLVKWSTVNELNNKYYDVERSSDGQTFSSIGQVAAGNRPASVQDYSYTDYKAIAGTSYYRLKQVDADGHSSYSVIAKVIVSDVMLSWSIQPNPARAVASFYARKNLQQVSITLHDVSGKLVYTAQRSSVTAGEQVIIPVSQLAKGMYYVTVKSGNDTRTEKLVIE